MKKSKILDKKIVALQIAVEALKSNRNQLLKELDSLKGRSGQKSTI